MFDPPPISALFLVVFDPKVGYSIAWQRSLPDVHLDGVEFKSLPSGLHAEREDVVYFLQGACAGVSAFAQEAADAQHRNASFAAVGALVPLSHGRMGRGWVLAPDLRRMARDVAKETQDMRALEAFWDEHKQDESATSALPTQRGTDAPTASDRRRKRAASDITGGLASDQTVEHDHPALCMPELLHTFGPLTFPLFRAALLRRRILLLGAPPVQRTCNFVYVLSVLANIPPSLREVLQPDMGTAMRIQPLFSVGISDIPLLTPENMQSRGQGCLACTTDDILREKHQLYDLLVTLPGPHSTKHRWPTITTSSGLPVKATQRDLRRYHLLRAELGRIRLERERYRDHPPMEDSENNNAEVDEDVPLVPTTTLLSDVRPLPNSADDSEVVEPTSWTAMAYNGFLWWASAGEMEAWESEEAQADRALLDDLPEMDVLMEASSPSASRTSFSQPLEEDQRVKGLHKARATAMVVTAYFHRLTIQILTAMADVVEAADDETEAGEAVGVSVSSEDMKAMGLDPWSGTDRLFVAEALKVWFGREGAVDTGRGMSVCGVRIC